VHKKIMAHPRLSKSVALTRMGRVLSMWINTEDTERTLSYARIESEMDIYLSDSSYRANRLYIWAMPLLGFVGTVFGVSAGIGGFAEFLRGQVTSEEIKYQVGLITEGLAVAFYCTLLGLMTAGIAAFPSLAAEKREEEFIGELDQYMEDRITSRLPSVRKVEFPKSEFTAMRENLERLNIDITGDQLIAAIKEIKIDFPMEELTTALSKIKFELPIDDLTKALQGIKFNLPMDELTEALQNIKFNLPMEDFVSGIKDGLQDLRLNVIMPMEDLSRAIEQGFRRLPDPDNYVTVFSRAIADASAMVTQKNEELARGYEQRLGELTSSIGGRLDGVANKVQSGSAEVAAQMKQQAAALVGEFQSAIEKVNEAASAHGQRVDASSKALADQVKRVTEVAAQIDGLLHASKAMESALAKIGSAEEFGQTLASIRSHLSTNDAFVQRMTKPRKIVLQEEVSSSV
jgi:methyl-accepting chemotaxis protein